MNDCNRCFNQKKYEITRDKIEIKVLLTFSINVSWPGIHLYCSSKTMLLFLTKKYCAGLAFAISRDLVSKMYDQSLVTPFFWVDDAYVTGLLTANLTGVNRVPLNKYMSLFGLYCSLVHSWKSEGIDSDKMFHLLLNIVYYLVVYNTY